MTINQSKASLEEMFEELSDNSAAVISGGKMQRIYPYDNDSIKILDRAFSPLGGGRQGTKGGPAICNFA